jgi:hypothetical protein
MADHSKTAVAGIFNTERIASRLAPVQTAKMLSKPSRNSGASKRSPSPHRPSAFKVAGLVVNVVIVAYLVLRLRRERHEAQE